MVKYVRIAIMLDKYLDCTTNDFDVLSTSIEYIEICAFQNLFDDVPLAVSDVSTCAICHLQFSQ